MEDVTKLTEKLNVLIPELEKTHSEMKSAIDGAKGHGELSGKMDKLNTDFVTLTTRIDDVKGIEKRISELETQAEHSVEHNAQAGVKPDKHMNAAADWFKCAGKESRMKPETREFIASPEFRALTETVTTQGGFLLPPQMEAEILKPVTQVSPVRRLASIRQLPMGMEYITNKRSSTPTVYRGTEISDATATSSAYGQMKIPITPITAKTLISNKMLSDIALIQSEIREDISEQFAYKEGYDFVLGNGVNEPYGFVTGAGTDSAKYFATVTSATDDALDKTDPGLLMAQLKSEYWAGSTLVMNQATLITFLNLAATYGIFYWQQNMTQGLPGTIWGIPWATMPDMAAVANGALAMGLVNFKKAYRIIDWAGMEVIVDPYTGGDFQTYFKFRIWNGGQIIQPEAGKLLAIQ